MQLRARRAHRYSPRTQLGASEPSLPELLRTQEAAQGVQEDPKEAKDAASVQRKEVRAVGREDAGQVCRRSSWDDSTGSCTKMSLATMELAWWQP